MSLEYYPLSFGIIIGLSNWDRYKIHPLLGVLFCLILSYLAFFGGYFSIYITNIVFQSYGELGKNFIIIDFNDCYSSSVDNSSI